MSSDDVTKVASESAVEEQEDQEDEEEEEEEGVDHPSLDRGWAWMVVLASLLINIIYDGCSYSFGILFTNLLDYFGDSKSETAWIGSLFFSVPLLCGPLAALAADKIGYRKSTMLGGVIASIGFTVSAFSTSTQMLCLTYGVIAGLGMSLPYFNSIVVVAVYFRKKRAFATGIAECGAGVGTIIFAPLTDILINSYGWRGAMLILGAIVSNIVVCGALYRPLPVSPKSTNSVQEEAQPLVVNSCVIVDADKTNGFVETPKLEQSDEMLQPASIAESRCVNETIILSGLHVSHLSHSCRSINISMSNLGEPHDQSETTEHSSKAAKVKAWINENIGDFSMLAQRAFLLFALSNFIMYFWYDVPYVFLVDKAIAMGITDLKATFLVSIIGIVHTLGNIMYGLVADRDGVNTTVLYGSSIILCGLSVLLIPFFSAYIPLAILAGGFGLFSAANEALCSIILVDVVGLSKLNQAYGVIMLLQGIANLVGPPVAGWLCDISGEYNLTFSVAGSCVILAGIVYLLLPVVKRCVTTRPSKEPEPNTEFSER